MLKFKQSELPKQIHVTVGDPDGDPTTVQNPSWSSGNGSLFTIGEVSPDGLTATIELAAPHALGVTTLTFSGDADLGAGVSNFNYQEDIEIVPDNASNFSFSVM